MMDRNPIKLNFDTIFLVLNRIMNAIDSTSHLRSNLFLLLPPIFYLSGNQGGNSNRGNINSL
eukprot:UN01594